MNTRLAAAGLVVLLLIAMGTGVVLSGALSGKDASGEDRPQARGTPRPTRTPAVYTGGPSLNTGALGGSPLPSPSPTVPGPGLGLGGAAPTATVQPTQAAQQASPTPAPPTNTPPLPTSTQAPRTATPIPPTPTATQIPPTPTPAPPPSPATFTFSGTEGMRFHADIGNSVYRFQTVNTVPYSVTIDPSVELETFYVSVAKLDAGGTLTITLTCSSGTFSATLTALNETTIVSCNSP